MKKLLIILVLTLAAFRGPAAAVQPVDLSQIKTVIEAQLNAFSTRDADRAFAVVSPAVRVAYKNASTFMKMVEDRYTPLFYAKRWRFDEILSDNGQTTQIVYMSDPLGNDWLTLYQMVRGQDGAWRIDDVNMGLIEGILT
ncbi:MAG: DUF4864 domain-containing protein [Rhodospirillaceae bacterium]